MRHTADEIMTTEPATVQTDCEHLSIKAPNGYDHDRARTMTREQIRATYPRGSGTCPDCGCSVTTYVSMLHYLMGDW
jgi:hypothetical protein